MKKKRKVNKIRNERGEMSQKYKKKIISKYYEQLYANKLNNLKDMDKFLEAYSPTKLNPKK